jgi:hypothetical protein
MTVAPGKLEDFKNYIREYEGVDLDGHLWTHVFQADSDSNEFWLAVAFDDAHSYRANADDPAQHERFVRLRALLVSDPEWHDGTVVESVI